MTLAKEIRDDFIRLGSAHGRAVQGGALRSYWADKNKKRLGTALFWLLFSCCWEKSNTPSRAEDQQWKFNHQLQAKAYKQTKSACSF